MLNVNLLTPIKAGAYYAAGVFAVGFALGGVRTIFIAPLTSATIAVVIELPFILFISWLLCRRTIGLMAVRNLFRDRAAMGVFALVFLLTAEFALWLVMFAGTAETFVARYQEIAGIIGLCAQITFGLFPIAQIVRQP